MLLTGPKKKRKWLESFVTVMFIANNSTFKVVDSCQGFCMVPLKDDQFNLLMWLLLSLLSLFTYSKAINFHAIAINI